MAQELVVGVHGEADLIEIVTRLACEGYWQDIKQVMEVSKVFRYDEQLWDAIKDEQGGGALGRTRLMYAALVGDLECVRFLLDRGARWGNKVKGLPSLWNWWNQQEIGWTALIFAVGRGHLEIVRELANRGACVNASCGDDGLTPLISACNAGHLEVVRELFARDADVHCALQCGTTALMGASTHGHLEVVRELCHWGANVNAAKTDDGFTALMWASFRGHLEVVCELCEMGADVNAVNLEGRTALVVASMHGYLKVVCALAERGADVGATSNDGHTALTALFMGQRPHYYNSLGKDHLEVVRLLCSLGADVNAVLPSGDTPLTLAIESASMDYSPTDIVLELCEYGADASVARGRDGFTALMWASQESSPGSFFRNSECINLIDYLCDLGADVNAAMTADGLTPLMMCVRSRIEHRMYTLLRRGANVNAALATDGSTALIHAFQSDFSEGVRILCDAKNVNLNVCRKSDGVSALMWACEKKDGESSLVRAMCAKGAHVDAACMEGKTALMRAAKAGRLDVCTILLEHGASKSLVDKEGNTAHFYGTQICDFLRGQPQSNEDEIADIQRTLAGLVERLGQLKKR